MRYDSDHKRATRQRILATAGRRIKQDGIDGSGVAALMSDAGLTNGAFYAHFTSKDDLIAHVVADQLRLQLETLSEYAPGREGIEAFLKWYLSAEHCNDRVNGCPSAALLDEISRCSEAVRAEYTSGLLTLADDVTARLAATNPTVTRAAVLGAFATLIGTVQLARAVSDPTIVNTILEQGATQAIAALGLGQPSRAKVIKRSPTSG